MLIPQQPVTYQAGQFLVFIFRRNGREIRRSYSFSSAPGVDEHICITLKRTANGEISRWFIDEAAPGDELLALPPAGIFTVVPSATPRDIFFVAAGSGITPIFSLLRWLLVQEPSASITLIYSNSSRHTTVFHDRLQHLQNAHPQLTIEWLFSNSQNLLRARLSGYILQDILSKQLRHDKKTALLYTCGPYAFMQMAQIVGLSLGFEATNIRREIFDEVKLSDKVRRWYDTNDRTVTIIRNGTSHAVPVPYQKSILDAALDAGLTLPYSCHGGRCSTCRCKVLHGKVWMHYNEVLTDADEAEGYALTCTGHPVTNDVVIEV